MLDARLTLTDEFKNKLNQTANQRRLSELRQERLQELDEKGYLSMIKTRFELGLACGYTDKQYARIASWVGYMVKTGRLTETLIGTNKNGRAEYEYHYKNLKTKKLPVPLQTRFTKQDVEVDFRQSKYEVELITPTHFTVKLKLNSFDEVKNIVSNIYE